LLAVVALSLIHISEPTRQEAISCAAVATSQTAVLQKSLPRTATAVLFHLAGLALREVIGSDASQASQLTGAVPYLQNGLLAHVAAGDEHLHTGIYFAPWVDCHTVTPRVTHLHPVVGPHRRQTLFLEHPLVIVQFHQLVRADAQVGGTHRAVVHRGDGGVKTIFCPQLLSQLHDVLVLPEAGCRQRALQDNPLTQSDQQPHRA
jgi:hypothetical protein